MRSRHIRALLLAAAVALASVATTTTAAHAATGTICDQYGSTAQGNYIVQNNRWGTSATQCINVTDNGFQITRQDGVSTSGAPVSYPSIYLGCHYGNCSPNSPLPRQISAMTSVNSSISYTFAGGTFDASYDIWLDPSPKTTGLNQQEIMIWFNRQGGVQPVGSATGSTTIGGRSWTVWTGNNGGNNVVSYVAGSVVSSWNFNVLDFLWDSFSRGYGAASWYLTSIQAGFEPWSGGVGLAVNSFSATVANGTPGGPITGLGNKCVDVLAANPADGTPVQLYTCNGTAAQQWTIGSDHSLRALGKCLDVTGANAANGTPIQLYTCNGTAAQQWTAGTDHGLHALGKCLDVTGNTSTDGTRLQLWDCYGGTNQQWTLPS